jgi:orotate phosphoribosyltransferase
MDVMNTSVKVAEYLLDAKAVQLNVKNPYTWASGLRSPIYCDNRKLLSRPHERTLIRDGFVDLIKTYYPGVQIIAGVATGAIGMAALIAQKMELPMIYVRSEAKKHGLGNRIEGSWEKGSTVVVIEDLVSTGKSSLEAVNALRDEGCDVLGMMSIFTYGFLSAAEAFKEAHCSLHSLSDFQNLLNCVTQKGWLSSGEIELLSQWNHNAAKWSEDFLQKNQSLNP